MDVFAHMQLLWKVEMMLGRKLCFNWEIFMDVSLWVPHLSFGSFNKSVWKSPLFHRAEYNCAKLCKCIRTVVQENMWVLERDWVSSCYQSHGFLPERNSGLEKLWDRNSILLSELSLVECLFTQGFPERDVTLFTWDVGFWLMCFNWLWFQGFVCRNLLQLIQEGCNLLSYR